MSAIKTNVNKFGSGRHPGMYEKSYPANSSGIKTDVKKQRSGNDSFGNGKPGRPNIIKTTGGV